MEASLGSWNDGFNRRDYRVDLGGRTFLTGQSGTGKSTIMRVAATQVIQAGEGLLFVDFHGDTAEELTGYIPRKRFENGDVVYWNPLADRVPSLNTFSWLDEYEKENKIQSVLSMFRSLYKLAWGPESERIALAGLDAITEYFPRPNLLHLALFVSRTRFRRTLLSKCTNPTLKDFAEQYDNDDTKEGLRPSERMSKFSPVVNKTSPFLRPALSPMLGQDEPLDWKMLIDSRKIIIVNLNKGKLGTEVASLIGSLILSEVWNAALRRDVAKKNAPFYCFVDEAQNCLHGIDIDGFLSESRKYRIFPFFGMQYLKQIPNLEAAFGNYTNWLTYRLGGTDAGILADEMDDEGLVHHIVNMASFRFIGRTLINYSPSISDTITARSKVKKLGDEPPRGAVIGESLKRWGRDRKEMREKVKTLLMGNASAVGSPGPSRRPRAKAHGRATGLRLAAISDTKESAQD